MQSFLEKMTISVRISILSFVPLLLLMGLGAIDLIEKRSTATEAEAVADVVALAPVISGLVHELQKERGTSAGFIGSKGARFADTIGPRRADTDRALKAFLSEIPDASGRLDFDEFKTPYLKARAELQKLAAVRSDVDRFSRSVPQMAAYYTPLIASLLSSVEGVGLISKDGSVVKSLTAYMAFLQAKERAGIERAMGASGFGAGQFAEGIYRKFVGLGAQQDAFASVFEHFANSSDIEAWQKLLASSEQQTVDALRGIANKAPFGGDVSGVTGPQWFKASTERIDRMKQIEDGIADSIVKEVNRVASRADRSFWILLAGLAMMVVLGGLMAFLVTRSVTAPMLELSRNMELLARNQTDLEMRGLDRADEIGAMARAVNVFRENAVERLRLERAAQGERDREQHRQLNLGNLVTEFRTIIDSTLVSVRGQTDAMNKTASTLSEVAESATNEAGSAERASAGASGNVKTVADATEIMVAAVREISDQAGQARDMVSSATGIAEATNKDVASLAEAAERIGTVVSMIGEIADQTNLLALNATIEAARAGEMGKGFAVVASEVKELASQTTKATEEISSQIAGVQSLTENAVSAIGRITHTVSDISSVTGAISDSIEHQQSSMDEIASSIHLANSDTQDAMRNVQGVTSVIGETANEARTVKLASDELTLVADKLAREVEGFLHNVAQDVKERRASLRVKMNQIVVVQSDGRRVNAKLANASETGCKIENAGQVKPGDEVVLQLADGKVAKATVVWQDGDAAGFKFEQRMDSLSWYNAA
ncbi:Methyl-accepting chemotaxis protein [Cohaesibacter sp. ES.047]|nr:Methyl-accepting chemotaxis protein [Cohaesibacter sp. ES.047]